MLGRTFTLVTLLLCSPAATADAQALSRPRSGFSQSAEVAKVPAWRWSVESRSYWKEGFIAGTVIVSLALLPFAGWGGDSITLLDVMKVTIGGSLLGGVPGALFGGLFPKRAAGP